VNIDLKGGAKEEGKRGLREVGNVWREELAPVLKCPLPQ